MAKIISVINTKGGVGKTTIVISIAEFLIKSKFKVCLIDIDSQKSLLNWCEDISKEKREVIYSQGKHLLKTINKIKDQYDYIVIDTSPAVNTDTIHCVQNSNICLIPVTPSQLDIYAINNIVDIIFTQKDFKAFFLLNKVIFGAKITERAIKALNDIGQNKIKLLEQKIFNRVGYAQSIEEGVGPLSIKNKKITNEINNIMQEIFK